MAWLEYRALRLRLAGAGSASLNAFPQFKVALHYIDVHFLHVPPGKGPKPYPLLLMLHGWPGSVFEFMELIPRP